MNFSDSEIVGSILRSDSFSSVADRALADLILINTCSVRENAEQRVWKRLRELKGLKKKNKNLVIGIIGCMAERLKNNTVDNINNIVDIYAGPDNYRTLPGLVNAVIQEKQNSGSNAIVHPPVFDTQTPISETYDDIVPLRFDSNNISAFISIMRGCENFCSYCVVPFTRGKERSRSHISIINDARKVFNDGYREITLLGQNVNSYNYVSGDGTVNFSELMEMVADISPQLRIRFTTSHPKDLSDDLLKVIAGHKNICRSIHLPLQSGSDRILKLMNRKYTLKDYLNRIDAVRSIVPDAALSTDIITGFCSETDDDHRQTIAAINLVRYDYAYMFKYSQRAGTLAARKLNDDIPEHVKSERLDEIIKLQQKLSLISNRNDIGKITEVLVENISRRSPDFVMGRNSQNKVVIFPKANHRIGDYVNVRIVRCSSATLFAENCAGGS